MVIRDASERRAAEASLRGSEERLQLALRAGKLGVWDWNVVADRIDWSDLIYTIHGLRDGDFDGKLTTYSRYIHPDDRAMVEGQIAKALEGSQPFDTDFRVVQPNGSVRWVTTTATVFRNEAGQPVRMLGAIRDITARKQSEADLRQQWRIFDVALSNTADGNYIFDRQGRFQYANRATLTMLGETLEEVRGKSLHELHFPPETAARLHAQILQVVDRGKLVRDKMEVTNAASETRLYEYIFVPIEGPHGEVEAVAGSTRDITEDERIRQALAESRDNLRRIFAQASVAIATFRGPDLVVEMANPAYQALAPARDLVGTSLRKLVSTQYRSIVDDLTRVLQTGEPHVANEWKIRYDRDRDGVQEDHWFNLVYNPLRKADGSVSGIVAVLTEVTEQVLARQAVERVNRELEQFAYVASHDLQEPLRMVNTFTQLLFRSNLVTDTPESRQYTDFITKSVHRMEQLIRDLLSYSRAIDSRDLIPRKQGAMADLTAAWNDALTTMGGRIAESGAKVTCDVLPVVPGDTAQFSQVFQNLLSNAIKYRKADVAPEIAVASQRSDGNWIVSVRDNGIGFDQKYAQGIFGLFKRLHRDEYPGTGLGLAICQRIVQRFGGTIRAESEPGKGAVFFISLPAASADGMASDAEDPTVLDVPPRMQ
jgi:PAS domain S-box-containing protein